MFGDGNENNYAIQNYIETGALYMDPLVIKRLNNYSELDDGINSSKIAKVAKIC